MLNRTDVFSSTLQHYPKLDKYISLYPSTEAADPDNAAETDRLRTERRQLVREAMEKGEMDAEPEMRRTSGDAAAEEDDEGSDVPVDSGAQESDEEEEEPTPTKTKASSKRKRLSLDEKQPKSEETNKAEKKKSKQKPVSTHQQQLVDVKEDDFFDT